MLTKTTKSLFKGTYQYKIVLVCSIASAFRSGDMESTLDQLKKTTFTSKDLYRSLYQPQPKTQEQLDYAFKLQHQIKKLKNIEVRVESPYISVYTNL